MCASNLQTTYNDLPPQAQHNPVVIIPGGPGLPHDYLETLEGAAKDDRVVLLFDPIGTGNSTALPADVLEKAPSLLGTASLVAQVISGYVTAAWYKFSSSSARPANPREHFAFSEDSAVFRATKT